MTGYHDNYVKPRGLVNISRELLDTRSDEEIDQAIANAGRVASEKNVWFYWHSGVESMHGYMQRNVRTWHRRLSKRGWTIRVVNDEPDSPMYVGNFLNVHDATIFPAAFINGTLEGSHAHQHKSDLVRFPLLLKYGGVYADAGYYQIGDIDRLWTEHIINPESPYEVASYDMAVQDLHTLANYFLVSRRDDPYFARCHKLFLALWAEDGGKISTENMHKSRLVAGIPRQGLGLTWQEDGRQIEPEEGSAILTDYIIQGQVLTTVLATVDSEDNWDGPEYASKHIYNIEFMIGAQYINELTNWDGQLAWDLMSMRLPEEGKVENDQQKRARDIVEKILCQSFGFKTATGLILRVLGNTLGSLWRAHAGSDDVPGTYAHWLRYGMLYWAQPELPHPIDMPKLAPLRTCRLLEGPAI